MSYEQIKNELLSRYPSGKAPGGINIDHLVQLKMKNTYSTHLDIAKDMAKIMRNDMKKYDANPSLFTQSLGCWSGFHAQQMIKAVKKYYKSSDRVYVYLSGWMIAAIRNKFGPLPDQSMHEKTAVIDLINEIYTSLRQADSVAITDLFCELNNAKTQDDKNKIINKLNTFESHVRPMIADIDAGFGNTYATYMLAKEMIKAGACCIQIENQVSDIKKCGHMAGKVTMSREEFIDKIKAVRMAFEELGVHDGIIVARTDSLDGSLTQKIPVSNYTGDLAYEYNKWLEYTIVNEQNPLKEGDMALMLNGQLVKLSRLPDGLFRFRENTGYNRVIEDSIANLTIGGADLIWIETSTPDVNKMAEIMKEIRKVVPDAKLVYNNSPSFNWTLNLRKQVRAELDNPEEYPDDITLMSEKYDNTELAIEANRRLKTFQTDISREAGVFHNLITLPTFHMTAKSMHDLAKRYFGDDKMFAYIDEIQLPEIRNGVAAVKHQHEVGSNVTDSFLEMVSEDRALKAGGHKNTMNQF